MARRKSIPGNGTSALPAMASKVDGSNSRLACCRDFRGQENSHGIPLAPMDNACEIRNQSAVVASSEPHLSD